MNAKQAWALLATGVLSYEFYCKDGELLSECVDRWLLSRPILTRAVIAALALHLANAVPVRYDIVSLGFLGMRRAKRRWRHPAACWPGADARRQPGTLARMLVITIRGTDSGNSQNVTSTSTTNFSR